jgi:hypothetical protein
MVGHGDMHSAGIVRCTCKREVISRDLQVSSGRMFPFRGRGATVLDDTRVSESVVGSC